MFVLMNYNPPQWSERVKSVSRQEWQRTTEVSGGADFLKGMDFIQWDFDKFKEWTHVNIMTFNKCNALHVSQGKTQ